MSLLRSGTDFLSFHDCLILDSFKESKFCILQGDLGHAQFWSIWCFFMTRFKPCIPGKNPKNGAVLFSVHHSRRTRCQIIPSLMVVALHLTKAVSTSIHHKVTISFFVVNEYFVEKYYETMPIPCFSSNLHPPIDTSCFHQSSLWRLPNGDFSFFHPPSTFIGWHFPVTKSLPFPIPIYLLLSIGSLNLISFNRLLSLFILILQFFQIWLVRVPCTCFCRRQI